MSKINRVRFVNFTYNENRHIYDETFDFFGGENTLLNLQNGGGKTVLVQMMMQPIIPKQRLKDRLFKSYFTKSVYPTYIMIEWKLDHDAGYVLTGIGIKKISGKSFDDDTSDNLKIVTFISEYIRNSSYDIENINLTHKENGITKLNPFDKVVYSLSNAEKNPNHKVKLFRWDQPEDKKRYIEELATFKIYQPEWKKLMLKINESEAGLTTFFNDSKTSKALIKNWFLPTIEEQLNNNGKVVNNIRDLIKNHAEQLVKNEKVIKEKRIFEEFKIDHKQTIENLHKYQNVIQEIENTETSIGNLYLYLREVIKELSDQKKQVNDNLSQLQDKMNEVIYDDLSYKYHKIESQLKDIGQKIKGLQSELEIIEENLKSARHKEKVLLCAQLHSKIQDIERDIKKNSTKIKKLQMVQEEIDNQISQISYNLKIKYKEKNEKDLVKKDFCVSIKKDKGNEINDIKEMVKKKDEAVDELISKKTGIEKRIEIFEVREKELQGRYPDFTLNRNFITREYNELELRNYKELVCSEEQELQDQINQFDIARDNNLGLISELNNKSGELNSLLASKQVQESKHQNLYDAFTKKKEQVLGILKEYQLPKDNLFERHSILEKLDLDIKNYNCLVSELKQENKDIDRKITALKSGRSIELEEDLERVFKENNIDFEFGLEWLQNYSKDIEYKEKLTIDNPFIPYSIILSRKDYERLKRIDLEVFTSNALPMIERERLEEYLDLQKSNQVITVDKINFILSFNTKLLDEEHLIKVIEEYRKQIEENLEKIKVAEESLKIVRDKKYFIDNFNYTKPQVEDLKHQLSTTKNKIEEIASLLKSIDLDHQKAVEENSEIDNQMRILLVHQGIIRRKIQEFDSLFNLYPSFIQNIADLSEIEGNIKKEKENISKLKETLLVLQEEIQDINQGLKDIDRELESNRRELAKYVESTQGVLMSEPIHELESQLKGLMEKSSGELQYMMEILDKNIERREEIKEEIAGYNIPEEEYIGTMYDRDKLSDVRDLVHECQKQKNRILNEIKDEEIAEAKVKSDLNNQKEKIAEQCNGRLPKQATDIGDTDFKKRKSLIAEEMQEQNKKYKQLESKLKDMDIEKGLLNDYEGFIDKVGELKPIKEELTSYRKHLLLEYKKLLSKERKEKDSLTKAYNSLENEYKAKADIFTKMFELLADDKRFSYYHALNVFDRAILQIDTKLSQFAIDIQRISDMENEIVNSTLGYVRNVYDEMDSIDKNSVIDIDGEKRKMLIIGLPKKEKLDSDLLKQCIKGTISKCRDLIKESKPMDNILENEINTYSLFDRLVGVNDVTITLLKIEVNSFKKKTWKQVIEETSGGEKFVSAFVVFISLLTYMRGGNSLKINDDSKVLIMDNPFGPITSEHLLKPLFEVAKKYNTQLICLTDLKEHTIYDRFNLVYALNIEQEEGRNEEYIDIKVVKKDLDKITEEKEILTSSLFKVEQQSFLEIFEKNFDSLK